MPGVVSFASCRSNCPSNRKKHLNWAHQFPFGNNIAPNKYQTVVFYWIPRSLTFIGICCLIYWTPGWVSRMISFFISFFWNFAQQYKYRNRKKCQKWIFLYVLRWAKGPKVEFSWIFIKFCQYFLLKKTSDYLSNRRLKTLQLSVFPYKPRIRENSVSQVMDQRNALVKSDCTIFWSSISVEERH